MYTSLQKQYSEEGEKPKKIRWKKKEPKPKFIRISEENHYLLRTYAFLKNTSMSGVLSKAIIHFFKCKKKDLKDLGGNENE